MFRKKKNQIAAGILAVLGLAIGIIGIAGMLAPPVITGIGFLLIAWVFWESREFPL